MLSRPEERGTPDTAKGALPQLYYSLPFTRVFNQSGRGTQPAAEPFNLTARLAFVKASSGSREPPRHPFFREGRQ
jgi:hypothetical protein